MINFGWARSLKGERQTLGYLAALVVMAILLLATRREGRWAHHGSATTSHSKPHPLTTRPYEAAVPAAEPAAGGLHGSSCQHGPGSKQAVDMGTVEPPRGCLHLQDVCADQNQLVLMDPAYRPDAPQQRLLPFFDPQARFNFPWRSESNPDALATEELRLPPLSVRAASSREATPELQNPSFNDSVVPMLFYPTWQENYGHTIGNNIGWLYTRLKKDVYDRSWTDRVRVVLCTPHGLAIPSYWHDLVAPLSPQQLESFADFSARQASVRGDTGSRRGMAPTSSGDAGGSCRSRCYRSMLVCSGDDQAEASNVWQAGQYIVQHYRPLLSPPPVTLLSIVPRQVPAAEDGGSRAIIANSSLYDAHPNATAAGGPHSSTPAPGAAQLLRVVFMGRQGADIRQMSNMDELLERCRRWNYTHPASGRSFVAACGTWVFKDLLTSIAVSQSADVLVGIHGATIANSFFMRPGGSVVELFHPAWPWDVHRKWLDMDRKSRLQWWALVVQDPAAYSPGELERQLESRPGLYRGQAGPYKMQRDRNMRVPWDGIDAVLKEIASGWGNGAAYEQARRMGRRHFVATADSVFAAGWLPPPTLLRK